MSHLTRVGFALTGSFCTHQRVLMVLQELAGQYDLTPILSTAASKTDTRFGTAFDLRKQLFNICGKPVLDTIVDTEPIGPMAMFDVLVVAPCTSNTLAKLAHGVTDDAVPMAVKSHLRGDRPVVIGISTNDALSGSASNLGTLLNRRNYYFVPMRQDAPLVKPRSLVAEMELIPQTIEQALAGKQLQPLLLAPNAR